MTEITLSEKSKLSLKYFMKLWIQEVEGEESIEVDHID